MAEVRSVPGVGGGRGVFALRDILAGEVVSQESPFVFLPKPDPGAQDNRPVFEQLTQRILEVFMHHAPQAIRSDFQ